MLNTKDKDLIMFTITNLNLTIEENSNVVYMELLTNNLVTIMNLNLTIMLVMTTIFTSKIEELPPTSDMKMIDIWLIFCLVVPFLEVLLRTAIESVHCSCDICKQGTVKDSQVAVKKEGEEAGLVQAGSSSGKAAHVWVGSGTAKVAPEQVLCLISCTQCHLLSGFD